VAVSTQHWRTPEGATGGPAPRFAAGDDAPEIVRLASLMYTEMGLDASDGLWQLAAREALDERLGHDVAVFVVDDARTHGRLAACGAASIATRLPARSNPAARFGYIQWVSTDFEWRRQGMARAITEALVRWLHERGARSIELHATPDGEALYRSLGFQEGPNPALRFRT
jgi:GNAT superfamily N-acetyltransferase